MISATRSDIVSESLSGVDDAISHMRLNDKANAALATVAGFRMKYHVFRNTLHKQHPVRFPDHTVVLAGKIRRLRRTHSERLDVEDIMAKTGESRGVVEDALAFLRPLVWLDHKIIRGANDPVTLQEKSIPLYETLAVRDPGTEAAVITMEETVHGPEIMRMLLDRLAYHKQIVLTRRFGLDGMGPKTLREIGEELGCSGESVRLFEKAALADLRHYITDLPEHLRDLITLPV